MYQFKNPDLDLNFEPGNNQKNIYSKPPVERRIKFKKGTTEFLNEEEEDKFDRVLLELRNSSSVSLEGFASSDGEKEANFKLSNRRVQKIANVIKKRYPNIKINYSACGEVVGDLEENRAVAIKFEKISDAQNEYLKSDINPPKRRMTFGNWYLCKETNELIWHNRNEEKWQEELFHFKHNDHKKEPDEIRTWKNWVKIGKTLDEHSAGGSLTAETMLQIYKKAVTVDKGNSPATWNGISIVFGSETRVEKPKMDAVYTDKEIEKIGTKEKISNKKQIHNYYESDNSNNMYRPIAGETNHAKLTHATDMFFVDDDFSADEFFNLTLSSWTYGYGYENYYFGPKSNVSEQLARSSFIQRAVEAWQANPETTHEYISNEPSPMNFYNEFIADGYYANGTYKTVSHTIGSAHVSYEYDEVSRILTMTVFNVMNVGSGTGANASKKINKVVNFNANLIDYATGLMGIKTKAPQIKLNMGRDTGYPRIENLYIHQPFTNVSQTIVIMKHM